MFNILLYVCIWLYSDVWLYRDIWLYDHMVIGIYGYMAMAYPSTMSIVCIVCVVCIMGSLCSCLAKYKIFVPHRKNLGVVMV